MSKQRKKLFKILNILIWSSIMILGICLLLFKQYTSISFGILSVLFISIILNIVEILTQRGK